MKNSKVELMKFKIALFLNLVKKTGNFYMMHIFNDLNNFLKFIFVSVRYSSV